MILDLGIYCCSKCNAELFRSTTKYEHSSPWPAFNDTVTKDCLSKRSDGPSALKVSEGRGGREVVGVPYGDQRDIM